MISRKAKAGCKIDDLYLVDYFLLVVIRFQTKTAAVLKGFILWASASSIVMPSKQSPFVFNEIIGIIGNTVTKLGNWKICSGESHMKLPRQRDNLK